MMIEKTIKVKIDNFEVDNKYYSFDYEIWMDDELLEDGSYNNDHCWDDLAAFENMMLNEGEAVKIALDCF